MPEGRCEASRRQTKPDWSLVDIYPAAASSVWAASPRGPVRVLGQFMHALHPALQGRHVRRRQSTAWTRRRAGRRRCWPYRGLPALRRECQAVCTNGIDTTWSRGAHVGASISHPPSHVSAPSVPGHRHPPAANKVEDKRLLAAAEPRPVGPPGVPKWVFGGVLAPAHALPFVYLQLSRRPPFHPRPALLPASLRSIRRVDFAAAPRVRFSPCAVARCRRPPLTVPPIGDLAETAGA